MLVIKINATGTSYTNDLVDFFCQQRALAVIVGRSGDDSPEFLEGVRRNVDKLRSISSPLVYCGRPPIHGIPEVPTVDYEQTGVVQEAVRILTQLGHRRIAFIGKETHMPAQLRMRRFVTGRARRGPGADGVFP